LEKRGFICYEFEKIFTITNRQLLDHPTGYKVATELAGLVQFTSLSMSGKTVSQLAR